MMWKLEKPSVPGEEISSRDAGYNLEWEVLA
jgi:hypothetical protein